MHHDPIASIKIWPITITVGDQDYLVPATSAARWLEILLRDRFSVLDLVPGLLDVDDQISVSEEMAEGTVSFEELEVVALDLITAASGRDWWWTMKLLVMVKEVWTKIFGQMVGLDLEKIPLAAFLDRVYYICETQLLAADKKKIFDLELETPPESVRVELDGDAESEAFMKMMQQAQQL